MGTYDGGFLQEMRSTGSEPATIVTSEPQNTLLQSAILHLGPGILITIFYVLTAPALMRRSFPPMVALLLAIILVVLPIEFGELVLRGYRRNGRYSFHGIVGYRQPLQWWQYPLIVKVRDRPLCRSIRRIRKPNHRSNYDA